MRTYYRTASVLVTDQLIRVRGRSPQRIAELDQLYVVDVRSGESLRWRLLRRAWPGALAVLGGIIVALHDLTWGRADSLVVLAVVMVCAAIVVMGGRGAHSASELWAITRSGHVCLFRSRDARTFGQVQRAVIRAHESRHA